MPSTFTWLDHSDRERRRVLDVIDRFRDTDTRDELGLGPLRDGFADLFFPGTSTVQTRARYFLFVPWVYQRVEVKGASERLSHRVRREEVKVRDALMASGDDDGVIGKLKAGATKRLPSSVYWLGLHSWGIRLLDGSQDQYHRGFERRQRKLSEILRDDDGDRVLGRARPAWHPYLPEPPDDFPEKASFALRPVDAQYLEERITFSANDSLLAFLVQHARSLEGNFPWQHPQLAEVPAQMRQAMEHARNLAEVMHGSALLYNVMLAEESRHGERDEWLETHRAALSGWCDELQQRDHELASWDRTAFWTLGNEIARVTTSTRQFVDGWFELRGWRAFEQGAGGSAARALVRERELRLKGKARARLGNPRALELWRGSSGTSRLAYRWHSALRVLSDIRGARAGGSHA